MSLRSFLPRASLCVFLLLFAGFAAPRSLGQEMRGDEAAAPTDADTEAAPDAAPDAGPRPTLEEIFRPPRLLGVRPRQASLSADGRWALWRWTETDAETPQRDLWIGRTDGSEARVLFPHDVTVDAQWTKTGATLLVERDGWLHHLAPEADAELVPLLETGGARQIELFDDGRRVLVVGGETHQVWVLDLVTGRRVTPAAALRDRAGSVTRLERAKALALFARPAEDAEGSEGAAARAESGGAASGGADKPSPRRLFLADLDGLRPPRVLPIEESAAQILVSPSGRWIVRREREASVARELILADYLAEQVTAVKVRGSLAGDEASPVSLTLLDAESGAERILELGGTQRFYLHRLVWSPVDDLLLVERLSNDFKVREVLIADPAAGAVWPLLSERDEAWIGGPLRYSAFTDDGGTVLVTSERSGFNHLFAVPSTGGEARALTAGRFELRAVLPVPHSSRVFALGTAEEDPASHRVYLLDVAAGTCRALTGLEGCASELRVSRDGSTLVYAWETLGVPSDLHALRLVAEDAGESAAELSDFASARLTRSAPAALAELSLPPPEIVTFENPSDGQALRAYLYRPEPFEAGRRYPAVMFIHGAGYLQNVKRSMSSYDVNMLFHHRLARKGYAVLDVDYRQSAGYGRDFRTDVHGHLGGKDLDDLAAGVAYLESLGFVDVARVGAYGGSYGGCLTLMALFTRPELFACGAALRSVTDWRSYNHWYTNPRLGDPRRDAENYARSSPIDHAAGLAKPLLLLHGLRDDNVFAQDTIRLMEALIRLGKDFDAMLYPSQNHGFTDPASWIDQYRRIERFFDRHLSP